MERGIWREYFLDLSQERIDRDEWGNE